MSTVAWPGRHEHARRLLEVVQQAANADHRTAHAVTERVADALDRYLEGWVKEHGARILAREMTLRSEHIHVNTAAIGSFYRREGD